MEEIITAAEVAALLRMHVRTVYRLAEEGILPGSKIGHSWRFRRKNILAAISERRNVKFKPGNLPGKERDLT